MIVVTLFARSLNSSSMFWSTLTLQWEGIRVGGTTFRHWPELLFSRAYRFKESTTYTSHTSRAVASNRPTEALASVISFVFVAIVIINTDPKYLRRELNHGPVASFTSFSWTFSQSCFFRLLPWQGELCLQIHAKRHSGRERRRTAVFAGYCWSLDYASRVYKCPRDPPLNYS